MSHISRALKSAIVPSAALVLSLIPVSLLGRLVQTIATTESLDTQLRPFPVYEAVVQWMNSLVARSAAGFFVLLLFCTFVWLANLAYRNRTSSASIRSATKIPVLFLNVATPSVVSLFMFSFGSVWDAPKSWSLAVVAFAVAFIGHFFSELGHGQAES